MDLAHEAIAFKVERGTQSELCEIDTDITSARSRQGIVYKTSLLRFSRHSSTVTDLSSGRLRYSVITLIIRN